MSETAPEFLLDARGTTRELGAWVVGLAFGRDGTLGLGLGDGTVRLAKPAAMAEDWATAEAHDGAVLSLAADPAGGFLTGGDDGRLVQTAPDGAVTEIAEH
jgi:hypothetical protein